VVALFGGAAQPLSLQQQTKLMTRVRSSRSWPRRWFFEVKDSKGGSSRIGNRRWLWSRGLLLLESLLGSSGRDLGRVQETFKNRCKL